MKEEKSDKKPRTSFFKEFREFAVKGNMLDMAVGIIIGTAFNKVVNTMVKQVIMPPLSAMTDGVHISDRKYVIRHAAEGVEEIAIEYGALIEALIDFFIIALTVFVFIKFFNTLREKAYQARIRTETDKLKEALEGVKKPEVVEESPLPQPQPEPVVEEKIISEESQLLANIEKLLQQQNEILKSRG
ncbi:MAG TPA: large conductance mechanosensitive channel protein MscL [Flavobacteriaceae bacterium]|nr:large conductance mechanosensitive channel protein MscL [Flavobacteriaceae bacterium]